MRILFLAVALAVAGCPDPDPSCPAECQEVVGLEGYVESCNCPVGIFGDDYVPADECAEELTEDELEEACEDL